MAEGKRRHDYLMWSELVATIINVNGTSRSDMVKGCDLDPFRVGERKAVGIEILKDIFIDKGRD